LAEFTCLLGGLAFSEFQRQKLVDGLRRRIGQEISFTAKFIYFVESPQAPSQQELSRLEGLLQAESIILHTDVVSIALVELSAVLCFICHPTLLKSRYSKASNRLYMTA